MSDSLRPFFSIMMIIVSLFLIVFVKMEARRINYSILRQSRQHQILSDRYHKDLMAYLKLTQGSKITDMARSQLTLDQARKGQVILLVGGKIAIPQ